MVRVHLVGRVAVEVDGAAVSLPPGRATEVLAWLAAHPGLHARSRVAPLFWPDVPDATSRASLRTALWALNKSLGEGILTLERSMVGLDPDVWVDLHHDEGVGPVLPGIEAEWADEVRADHSRRVAGRLTASGDEAEQAGDWRSAVDAARRLTALDPYSEECHRLLLRRLVASGEPAAAIREHDAFRRRLWDDLRVRPSPETRELVAGLPTAAEPVAAATSLPPRLLRAARQVFVGRESEHERLRQAWGAVEQGAGPAVMFLCGEPGIGKSCLAARFAADVHRRGGHVLFGEAAEDELLPAEPFLDAIGEQHSLAPNELV
ncbi:MAG TPA: BTAD domain-containing putative transcriptional regulator, partial [Acidimicrobiales bacterium]